MIDIYTFKPFLLVPLISTSGALGKTAGGQLGLRT